MSANDLPVAVTACEDDVDDLLSPLLQGPVSTTPPAAPQAGPIHGVIVGELLALADDGTVPVVRFDGQPGEAALRARSTVDLHGPHIGQGVVLMFEGGDPHRPIVMGVVRGAAGWPLPQQPAQVEVDSDGQRLVVIAKEQMVLRCGKASITLTKAGKVLIEGSYLLSRSTGMNRIKGGAVQIN